MRAFFDTEFVEDGKTIDLISIAIVADDGREYYAINKHFDMAKAEDHPFVSKKVLPYIMSAPSVLWKPKLVIASEVREFIDDEPEFWADYASYDWVALCQLYGTMMDLPSGWPMFCRDIQQYRTMLGAPEFTGTQQAEHDALADARECRARYYALAAMENDMESE